MANLFQPSLDRVTDSNGDPISGAKMYFWATGTSTPMTFYADQAETAPGTSPLVSNSVGLFAPAYLDAATTYRIKLTNSTGSLTIWDVDPVRGYDEGMVQTASAAAVAAAAQAVAARDVVVPLAAQVSDDADDAEAAALIATGAANSVLNYKGTFATTADALSNGVLSNAAITGGTGGTNGTFDGTVTGGGGSGAAFRFVVAGGALTQIVWQSAGRGYTTAPTLGFAASAGLTGASATAVIGANTVVGDYFAIPSAQGGGLFDWYVVSAGPVATYYRTAPNADAVIAAVSLAQQLTGTSLTRVGISTATVGRTNYDNAFSNLTNVYISADATQLDGVFTSLIVNAGSAGTGRFILLDGDRKAIYEGPTQTIAGAGLYTQTGMRVDAPAGTRIGFQWLTNGGLSNVRYNAASPGGFFTVAGYGGVGSTVTITESTVNGAAVSGVLETAAASSQVQIYGLTAREDATDRTRINSARRANAITSGGNYTELAVARDAGYQSPEGSYIEALSGTFIFGATIATLRSDIIRRPTNSAAVNAVPFAASTGDVTLHTFYTTPAALGAVSGQPIDAVFTPNKQIREDPNFIYIWRLRAYTSTGAAASAMEVGTAPSNNTVGRWKGWTNGASTASVDLAMGFVTRGARVTTFDDRIVGAAMTSNGLGATFEVQLSRVGQMKRIPASFTFTAPTGTKRYDRVVIDVETEVVSVLAGGEDGAATITGTAPNVLRPDATERMAALTSPTQLLIANVRVGATSLTIIPQWDLDNTGLPRSIAKQLVEDERFNDQALGIFRRALYGAGVVPIIALMGDSLMAIANGTAPDTSPNGVNRDRGTAPTTDSLHYLRDGLSDALVDDTTRFPLYTAVQLNRADDGAGAVHTKVGFAWAAISRLEAASVKLVSAGQMSLVNWAAAGSTAAAAVSGVASDGTGTPAATTFLTAVRDGVATGAGGKPHLVICNYGMNPSASIAQYRAQMAFIVRYLRAAGISVLVVGVGLKRSNDWTTYLPYNQAGRQAALANGGAHLSLAMLHAEPFFGAGIASVDACAANYINHYGPTEYERIGQWVAAVLA